MKRRRLLKSAVALPALALPGVGQSPSENVLLPTVTADAVAKPAVRFFTTEQLLTLERLSEILVPATETRPGSKQAGVAEFLDFLLSESSVERQALYRNGLNGLNLQSRRDYGKPFASLTEAQITPLLQPLTTAWKPDLRSRSFLATAKEDVLRATVNSLQFAEAAGARASGTGYYWLAID